MVISGPQLKTSASPVSVAENQRSTEPRDARFTRDGSVALENRLGGICQEVLQGIREHVPQAKLQAVVLGGGYGRGEGGVLQTATGDEPYNDLEFYVFLRGNHVWNELRYGQQLHGLASRLSRTAGLDIELKIDSLVALRRRPISMFSYDLVARSRLLYGSENVFEGCDHHLRAPDLPSAEASRLLLNRCTGLLLVKSVLAGQGPEAGPSGTGKLSQDDSGRQLQPDQEDFIGRNLAKAQLALGDVLLTVYGQYHWSCLERQARLSRLVVPEPPPWLERVRELHGAGVEFKLHPHRITKSWAQFQEEHRSVSKLAREVWLWLESERLNRPFATIRDYALSRVGKCEGTSAWWNYLLNLKLFGLKGVLGRTARCYPRERLFNSLPLLLWNSEAFNQVEIIGFLQNQLMTKAVDWHSLLRAYRRIWPAYG